MPHNIAIPAIWEHNSSVTTDRTSTFPCPLCSKSFNFKSQYERHMRSHTKEKPYACDLCSYRASQRIHLVRHMGVHRKQQNTS